ncbi:MAG: FHA domain-containing protein [Myxococcales bacterium]|nr:FHA domain-containing protein [Myxococcales bacterium]
MHDETNNSGRRAAQNRATMAQIDPDEPARPFAEVFAEVFPVLRSIHAAFHQPGLLVVAVRDGRRIESHLHLDLSSGGAHALIGRHQRCDLYLAHDPAISLRHALLRATRVGKSEVRLRLLDLCSGVGFYTEDDVPCESLTAEGALFVRAGHYHLLLLPTGDLQPSAWGDDAGETWASFPERIYLDRRIPDRLPRPIQLAGAATPERASRTTHIVPAVRPLRAPSAREGDQGLVIAQLALKSRSGQISHPVTDADLEHGRLVGRYERCQLGGAENSLSRVHLLVLRDGDGTWAIDTASTNGTTLDGDGVRAVRLDVARELGLGGSMLLEWTLQVHAQA